MEALRFNEQRLQTVKLSFLATFLWGMAAHAYGFLNFTVSHDSLYEFITTYWQDVWKNSLGRIFVQPYHDLFRGDITIPWLIGALSLVYASLAVYLVVRMFSVRNKASVFLIAGVFVANISVTCNAATYMHDLDANMTAMLLSTTAAYLWKEKRYGFLLGIPLITVSLGLYQSFVSVAIVLILFACIQWLLNGRSAKEVFFAGLKGCCMLLGGGGLYIVAIKVNQIVYNTVTSEGTPSSFSNLWTQPITEKLSFLSGAYAQWYGAFRRPFSMFPATILLIANCVLLAITVYLLVCAIRRQKMKLPELLLLTALLLLIPLGSNICFVLNSGLAHVMMQYSFWFIYLLPLLFLELDVFSEGVGKKALPGRASLWAISLAMIAVFLWGNILTANSAYLKKDLERQATLSSMTRAMNDLNHEELYIRSETPIAFYGFNTEFDAVPGFEELNALNGCDLNSQITYDYHWAYIRYILNEDVVLCPTEQYWQIANSEALAAMPRFPDRGYIQMIDGVMAVKMGP